MHSDRYARHGFAYWRQLQRLAHSALRVSISSLLALAIPSPAAAAGHSGKRGIVRVFVENAGVYIDAQTAWDNPDGCANSKFAVVQPTTTSQHYYLSVALTALSAKKEVSLWLNGCASGWGTAVATPYIFRLAVD